MTNTASCCACWLTATISSRRGGPRQARARDTARSDVRRRHVATLEASKPTVTEVFGIGPLTAAIVVGRVGDVRRFPTAGHFARHNGTARRGGRFRSQVVAPSRDGPARVAP
jgi:transposase